MARFTRSSFVDILQEDFVRTARAKGLDERRVVIKHGLRNALIPVVTMMGLQFGFLLGGSIVVEKVFNWPGLGRLLVDAVDMRDYPVIQALVLLFSLEFILINLVVDVLYGLINPPSGIDDASRRLRTIQHVMATTGRHAGVAPLVPTSACARRGPSSGASSSGSTSRWSPACSWCCWSSSRSLAPWIVPYDAENFFDYDKLNARPSRQPLVRRRRARSRHLQPHPDGRAHLACRRLSLGRGRRGHRHDPRAARRLLRRLVGPHHHADLRRAVRVSRHPARDRHRRDPRRRHGERRSSRSPIFSIPTFARLVRGNTLALKHLTFIEAARSLGASDRTIIVRGTSSRARSRRSSSTSRCASARRSSPRRACRSSAWARSRRRRSGARCSTPPAPTC